MKTYQFFLFISMRGFVTSETNGFNFQQPSSKWAFAQSYSWVSSYGNNLDPLTQQSQEQAQIQQQMQQQMQQQIQQQMQQLTLQQQARQNQIQEALQQQERQAQLQQQINQQAVENAQLQNEKQTLPLNRFYLQSNSIRDFHIPDGRAENMASLSERKNENQDPQKFIDEIVRRVIQETRGEFTLPTARGDIEKIVRKILQEHSPNIHNTNSESNRHLDNIRVPNTDQNSYGTNTNQNRLTETLNGQNSITYPITPTERFNPQAGCTYNCGNSNQHPQPIAVAVANAFYPLQRTTDPRMVANSFTYTSV